MEPLFFVLPLFCIVGGTLVFTRSLEGLCGLQSFGLGKHQH